MCETRQEKFPPLRKGTDKLKARNFEKFKFVNVVEQIFLLGMLNSIIDSMLGYLYGLRDFSI